MNHSSSATIRERRSSIFFATVMVPCRYAGQRRVPIGESQANLVVSITGGDGPQDGLERTESVCGPFLDVDENGGALKYRVLPGSFRNWMMLKEIRRHNRTNTYPLMLLLARLFSLQRHKCSHLLERGRVIRMNMSTNRRDQKHLLVGLCLRAAPPIAIPDAQASDAINS